MSTAFIYDAVRTPRGRGKKTGSLYTVRPSELLATSFRALAARTDLDTSQVDDAVIGCVTQVGDQGACIARTAVLEAGWDESVPGVTLNRFCGSGLEAVNHAASLVASGFSDLVVAGGIESMSRVKMGSDGGAIADPAFQLSVGSVPQGISADLLATKYGIDRQRADSFAAESQRRAAEAWEKGYFAKSVVPVLDQSGLTILDSDEHPRPGTTAESLGKLKPSFEMMGKMFGMDAATRRAYPEVEEIIHIHHAGNSSGIVDGSTAVLLGSKDKGAALGLKPRARVRAIAMVGDEPIIMLRGPLPATKKALKKAGMTIGDIDLFEVNEAFAAVPLLFIDHFDVDPAKVNCDGGAIALGHPLGATGAILIGTVLDALERQDKNVGLVTLCIGGGMGIATIIERV